MSNQLGQPELGFILPDGERCLKEEAERGHIEVAFRILESDKRMKARFERSQWAPNNPVDFLIFDEGAAKVGNRWGETRIVQYYPYSLSHQVRDALMEYRSLNYEIREVSLPQGYSVSYFHR